jgi:hypothetical protein
MRLCEWESRGKILVASPTNQGRQNTPANRTKTGQFAPGASGNPSGRPRRAQDLAALAREHTEAAIEVLVEIMTNTAASPGARIAAANALLDRGYGKAPQSADAEPSNSDAFLQIWRALGSRHQKSDVNPDQT